MATQAPAGETPEPPAWMARIDRLAPGTAFMLGLLLSCVNPKNFVLVLGAAAGLAQLGISTTDARSRWRCSSSSRA